MSSRCARRGSKAEGDLEVDAAIGGVRGVGASGEAIRFAKERRAQVSHRNGEVHIVQYVSRGRPQRSSCSAG